MLCLWLPKYDYKIMADKTLKIAGVTLHEGDTISVVYKTSKETAELQLSVKILKVG